MTRHTNIRIGMLLTITVAFCACANNKESTYNMIVPVDPHGNTTQGDRSAVEYPPQVQYSAEEVVSYMNNFSQNMRQYKENGALGKYQTMVNYWYIINTYLYVHNGGATFDHNVINNAIRNNYYDLVKWLSQKNVTNLDIDKVHASAQYMARLKSGKVIDTQNNNNQKYNTLYNGLKSHIIYLLRNNRKRKAGDIVALVRKQIKDVPGCRKDATDLDTLIHNYKPYRGK